ncbi:1-deoxy-D-xylulose-5-phosphate synthase [Nocardia carnea]|uniref:1-deoxy-D-xylulose-5-phosphate synthase n=1 Tax=Nocardia carnea TaxID=37328 RepID=UPI000304E26D|nr:1-deoxy-D-xylulose-5-phosphate synthase [Nocardia carnea]
MTASTATDRAGILDSLSGPQDLATLDDEQTLALACEIRELLITTVTATGGHLGASLGTVELTLAVHRVFRSPEDVLIWDTGHQAYTHKLVTGRRAEFDTLRTAGGLSGYPSRSESKHDQVENSHASVSIAWAHGVARALALRDETARRVVAVIGDGALTGGVAWEGLNNLGSSDLPVVVIVNDNTLSYDPTAGALGAHLAQLRRGYGHDNLFATLGFGYLGPVDGHDVAATEQALRRAAALGTPVVVHVETEKGRGYPPAAQSPDRMHACGVVDASTGRPRSPSAPTWTDVFEAALAEVADSLPGVVAATAAMRLPTGLGTMSRAHPQRVFDSGIAEQHLLASAAGMAAAGLHPVAALYATFFGRAVDQALYDIGLHQLPVTLVFDRAGITGPDGPSHHGIYDLALLGCVPGMQVACPRDPARVRELLTEAVTLTTPSALRFPKSTAGKDIAAETRIGGIDILYRSPQRRDHPDVLLVAIGAMADACVDAATQLTAEGVAVTVADPRWVLPINPALTMLAGHHRAVVCVEDGVRNGGIGSRLASAISERDLHSIMVRALGVPNAFLPQGTRSQLLAHYGLTGAGIAAAAQALLIRQDRTGLPEPALSPGGSPCA